MTEWSALLIGLWLGFVLGMAAAALLSMSRHE